MSLTVLQIIPALGGGGAEQTCAEIAAGLVARGDRALVVSSGGVRVAEVEAVGGEHIMHNVATKNPIKIMKNAAWLAKLIQDQSVDVIHARSRAPAWSAWIASKRTGCRFVSTFHAVYHFDNRLKKAYNHVMARADKIIAISRYVANHIQNAYGVPSKKIHTIYRGIDLDRFHPDKVSSEQSLAMRALWGMKEEDRIVLLPGRLSPIKGHALAIEAMALLPEDLDKVKLVIIGDVQGRVAYRAKLESLIEARNLADRVVFVSHCADMPTAYSLAEVVLMTSMVAEGFGRVPVEAGAMGVPVIASNLGPTRETVCDEVTGWLLPPDDPVLWTELLAKALRLTKEQRATMGKAARTFVEEHFTKPQMVAATLAVYDELCCAKRN